MTPVFRTLRVRVFVLAGVVSGSCFVLVSGCALDWDVRQDPGDAAPSSDSNSLTDTAQVDGGGDTSMSDAAGDSPTVDCNALAAAVETARLKAKDCTLGTFECSTTTLDACMCTVVVNVATPSLTSDYGSAIDAYKASCTPDCSAACPTITPPNTWACLENGSSRTQCTP